MRMQPYLKHKTATIEIPEEARERARLLYTVTVTHDLQNGYVARVEEMPGLVVAEDTQDALAAALREVMALYIASAMRRGLPVPQPLVARH